MERVFYNFHSQLCGTVLRRSTSRSRRLLEYTVLLGGIFGFSVLLISHVSFVHRNQDGPMIPVSCLSSIPNFQQDNVDVTHIILLRGGENSYAITTYGGSPADNTTCHSRNPWKEENMTINLSFSKTSGFLLLPPEKVSQHNISTQWVGVSRTNTHCFGEPFLQRIVFGIVGPDTVLHNWLLSSFGSGFLYNPLTQNLLEMTPPIARIKLGTSSSSWQKQLSEALMWKLLSWKAGVVLTSIFLFFITTTLTSFTFRETQQRMLEFTIQLQNYVREDRPLVKLIFTHVIQNLLFVPIMVGMMFFLIEFYGGDKVLAFMVLSLVWVCEAFSVVSLRSQEGLQFFPRIFFLLFLVFHVYFFSFPHGFSYTALASTAAFLVHSMLFFLEPLRTSCCGSRTRHIGTPTHGRRWYYFGANNITPPAPATAAATTTAAAAYFPKIGINARTTARRTCAAATFAPKVHNGWIRRGSLTIIICTDDVRDISKHFYSRPKYRRL
mmetsp:Transcript_8012/g.12259  ORF Transcript_8012/g.12259 Transcript_8012/m.12259 type:complete len:494 (+) Transcript_8012:81-1562(+)